MLARETLAPRPYLCIERSHEPRGRGARTVPLRIRLVGLRLGRNVNYGYRSRGRKTEAPTGGRAYRISTQHPLLLPNTELASSPGTAEAIDGYGQAERLSS